MAKKIAKSRLHVMLDTTRRPRVRTQVSPKRMKKIDPISYDLWYAFVRPFVGRSKWRTKDVRELLASGPMATCPHPLVRQIIRDRRGVDSFQAAMMTWSYLAAMCRHHEYKLRAR